MTFQYCLPAILISNSVIFNGKYIIYFEPFVHLVNNIKKFWNMVSKKLKYCKLCLIMWIVNLNAHYPKRHKKKINQNLILL